MRVRIKALLSVAVVAGALAGTYGVIGTWTNVYYACVAKDGTMRIVSGPSTCQKFEKLISWNQLGPQGPKGDPGPPGPVGAASPSALSLALLRWYEANQLGNTFPVPNGSHPGVAFDGAHIWVVNTDQNSITKLRASDGAVVGTYGAGLYPYGVAFDGANLWVSNYALPAQSITKVRASDGALLGAYPAGSAYPEAVAFDGSNIWVAVTDGVKKLDPSNGAVVGAFTTSASSGSTGVAFDGANIWVAHLYKDTISKVRASDASLVASYSIPAPYAVAFDGSSIWVTNYYQSTVTKLRPDDGTVLGTYRVGYNPGGLAFDGTNIWVANYTTDTVTKLRACDGGLVGTYGMHGADALAFDGANVWVTHYGPGVTKM